jgi:hypothetical protein
MALLKQYRLSLVSLLLATHVALVMWVGYRNSPGNDEVGHLADDLRR